ncbi:unnamed protein product [Closterium sp. NIES-54]
MRSRAVICGSGDTMVRAASGAVVSSVSPVPSVRLGCWTWCGGGPWMVEGPAVVGSWGPMGGPATASAASLSARAMNSSIGSSSSTMGVPHVPAAVLLPAPHAAVPVPQPWVAAFAAAAAVVVGIKCPSHSHCHCRCYYSRCRYCQPLPLLLQQLQAAATTATAAATAAPAAAAAATATATALATTIAAPSASRRCCYSRCCRPCCRHHCC